MNIDLGTDYGKCAEVCAPCPPELPKKSYPCLYIECGEAMLKNLPDEGVIEIRYEVTSRTINERNGKKSCSLTLEAHEILDVEEPQDSAESALDKLAKLESAKE